MAIEVGNKVEGKITGIAHFGAFVDLGEGKSGLVHISEVSDKFIENIKDELEIGQPVMVKILSIAEDGKIALSIRKAQERPAGDQPDDKDKDKKRDFDKVKDTSSKPSSNKPSFHAKKDSKKDDFDSLMSSFLKDSEDRLASLKRNTEGKRGGRGGRRG